MTDYTTLTDNELVIAVVKALGWRVERRKPHDGLRYDKWCLIAPDGSICEAHAVGRIKPGKEEYILLDTAFDPNDLSACWTLFPNSDTSSQLSMVRDGFGQVAVTYRGFGSHYLPCVAHGVADNPCRALMLAYLAWKERQ